MFLILCLSFLLSTNLIISWKILTVIFIIFFILRIDNKSSIKMLKEFYPLHPHPIIKSPISFFVVLNYFNQLD